MDSIGVQVGVLLAILLLLERLVAARRHDGRGGAAALLTWFVLTSAVLWCGGLLAFAAVHALLFALGSDAAMAGAVLCALLLLATPFAMALVVRHSVRQGPSGG